MKKNYLLIAALLLAITTSCLYGQGEGNVWYFGHHAGLNFNTSPPTLLLDGSVDTGEGCTSVSDRDGNILFYTAGDELFDRNHNVMPNGAGLFGHVSSSQSAATIPKPGTYNPTLKHYERYYVVTMDYRLGSRGVCYTEVDMTQNGGNGAVVANQKNIHLFGTTTTECIGIAKHDNGCDFWVIGKQVGNNKFNSYQVSSSGFDMTPVISATGPSTVAYFGYMKVGKDNKTVAFSNGQTGTYVYNFDDVTGQLSLKFSDDLPNIDYCIEFSPDMTKLYATALHNPNLYQYDLTAPTNAQFLASRTVVGQADGTHGFIIGSVQQAPDGKLYVVNCSVYDQELSIVHNPNAAGAACNYDHRAYSIAPREIFLGLPTFPNIYLDEPQKIKSKSLCLDDKMNFVLENPSEVQSCLWEFFHENNPTTPVISQNGFDVDIQFPNPGTYYTKATLIFNCFTDTLRDTVYVAPTLDLGNDTTVCEVSLELNASDKYDYYTWTGGSHDSTLQVTNFGTYQCEVLTYDNNYFIGGDYSTLDTTMHSNYTLSSTSGTNNSFSTTNNPNSFNPQLPLCGDHTSGTGNMAVYQNNSGTSETVWESNILVEANADYVFSFWNQALQNPGALQLSVYINNVYVGNISSFTTTCSWKKFETFWTANTTGSINISIRNNASAAPISFALDDIHFSAYCKQIDSLEVVIGGIPYGLLNTPDNCENIVTNFTSTASISPEFQISEYNWDFGDSSYSSISNPSHLYNSPGTYNIVLELISDIGCTSFVYDTIDILPNPIADFTFSDICINNSATYTPNITTQNNDPIVSWVWNYNNTIATGSQVQTTIYNSPGTFPVSLHISSQNNCKDTISRNITVFEKPISSFTFNTVCLNDTTEFTNTSSVNTGTYTSNWHIDNTYISSSTNFNHSFTIDSTHIVSLEIIDQNGCSNSSSEIYHPYELPVAHFFINDTCQGLPTQLTNNSSITPPESITDINWYADNSLIGQTNQIQYVFNTPGSHPVTLEVKTSKGCVDSITRNTVVFPKPSIDFAEQSGCKNTLITFQANQNIPSSPISWNWNFGNGLTSTLDNPTTSYPNSGTFQTTLIATNTASCSDTLIKNTIIFSDPIADFDMQRACLYDSAFFDNLSSDPNYPIANYQWDFGDNSVSNIPSPRHRYSQQIAYPVHLIIENQKGCVDSLQKIYTPYEIPLANFSHNNTCVKDTINLLNQSSTASSSISQWNWSIDQLPLSNQQNPNISKSTYGKHDVSLEVVTTENCKHDTSFSIEFYPLPLSQFSIEDQCLNQGSIYPNNNSTIPVGTIQSFMWDFGDGYNSPLMNPVHSYQTFGNYQIQLTAISQYQCKDSLSKIIQIHPSPSANFTGNNLAGCSPVCVDLTDQSSPNGSNITNWQWTTSSGESSTNQAPSFCFVNESNVTDTSFTVSLKIENIYGCVDSSYKYNYIKVYHHPKADFYYINDDLSVFENEITLVNTSIGADYYHWDFGDSTNSALFEPTHTYYETGEYQVQLIVSTIHNCYDSISRPVILPPNTSFFIPNTFTPDGDGVNDTFFFTGEGITTKNFSFQIFNRWGDLIYATEHFIPWNGKFKGEIVKSDMYVYKIKYTNIFNKSDVKTGQVFLLK